MLLADCLDIVTYGGLQSLTKEECCVFIMSCIFNPLFRLAESAEPSLAELELQVLSVLRS